MFYTNIAQPTLRASLSGTFLQTLPDLVTPLKGHSLCPRSCPQTRSAPSDTFLQTLQDLVTPLLSCCLTSTEARWPIRDGEKGRKGVWRWGKREIIYIYLSRHCHHQNDFCIKMGSDESHFNVSVGSDGQSPVSYTHLTLPTKDCV